MKPKEEEIMGLRKGHFFLSCYEGVYNVYVQPSWLSDEDAIKIAKGKLDVDKIEAPDNLVPNSIPIQEKQEDKVEIRFDDSKIRKDLVELRSDFFNKIQELQNFEQKLAGEIYNIKASKHELNEDEIVSKILQKMPTLSPTSSSNINKDEIIKEILLRVPKSTGNVVYEVAPQEKIKKDFLEEGKNKVLEEISGLSDRQKKMLKFIESQGKPCSTSLLMENALLISPRSGSRNEVVKLLKEMETLELIIFDAKNGHKPSLKNKIEKYLLPQEAKPEEIEQVYNHILMEILK